MMMKVGPAAAAIAMCAVVVRYILLTMNEAVDQIPFSFVVFTYFYVAMFVGVMMAFTWFMIKTPRNSRGTSMADFLYDSQDP